MTEISDLERRLTGALDRMRRSHQATRAALKAAMEQMDARSASDAEQQDALRLESESLQTAVTEAQARVAELEADLATATAKIDELTDALTLEQEKVAAIAAENEADKAALAGLTRVQVAAQASGRLGDLQAGALTEQMQGRITDLEIALQQMQLVNGQLRRNNAALRESHEVGLADPDLINEGLQAEVEALQAVRAADRAEIDSVLAALKTLVEETEDA